MASIKDNFDQFGVMVDCSRNAVMTVPQLKRFFSIIAKMGYNQALLYIEDTYEVDNEPYFGYLRGRYSQAELKELDDYAYSIGLELIPCMQTLAHLNAIFRWPEYAKVNDVNDILLIDEPRTYELIENMISSLRKCFRTDKIHIGMDEAHMVGRGRYQTLHGSCDKYEIILRHLSKVVEITKKHGFQPAMWDDMFYRLATGGAYYTENMVFDSSVIEKVPEDVTLVYWDYYHTQKKIYDSMIRSTKSLNGKITVAGGAWRWSGFTAHNRFSIKTAKAALRSCIDNKVRSFFMTLWGDDGGEASTYAMLPTLCYAACLAQGITTIAQVKEKFREWVGYSFDDFMLLDLPDRVIPGKDMLIPSDGVVNPSKYLLYNDCFMGIFDSATPENACKQYTSIARKLRNAAKRTGEYSHIFDTASKLCAVLALKSDLGVRTRKAYEAKDMQAVSALITDYKKLIKRTESFYYAFRCQWYAENKPHGFDVQDIRLGGLITRLKSCCDRLTELRDGTIDCIPELEEELLALYTGEARYNQWHKTVTANRLAW